jgi:hypothetical protein
MVQKLANKQHRQGKNQGHFTHQPVATSSQMDSHHHCEVSPQRIMLLRYDLSELYKIG